MQFCDIGEFLSNRKNSL